MQWRSCHSYGCVVSTAGLRTGMQPPPILLNLGKGSVFSTNSLLPNRCAGFDCTHSRYGKGSITGGQVPAIREHLQSTLGGCLVQSLLKCTEGQKRVSLAGLLGGHHHWRFHRRLSAEQHLAKMSIRHRACNLRVKQSTLSEVALCSHCCEIGWPSTWTHSGAPVAGVSAFHVNDRCLKVLTDKLQHPPAYWVAPGGQ